MYLLIDQVCSDIRIRSTKKWKILQTSLNVWLQQAIKQKKKS